MDPLQQALSGAQHVLQQPVLTQQRLLLVGAGGVLGSAVPPKSAAGRLHRFAAWWLSQLNWMVPQRQQPLQSPA